MKTTKKRIYATPEIQVVNLDNEISLQLASPTYDPEEVYNRPGELKKTTIRIRWRKAPLPPSRGSKERKENP